MISIEVRAETMRVNDIRLAEELVVVASATGQLHVIVDPPVVA